MNVVAQLGRRSPQGAFEMLLEAGPETQIILIVSALFSLISWLIIFWKLGQFRRLKRQAAAFLRTIEGTERLEDVYNSLHRLPDSPYTRLFRHGVLFFTELRPGAFRDNPSVSVGLSEAQLQALRLVLEKVQGEEQDDLAAGLVWLAIIGTVAPLLGLLGTVVGVMDAFLGITAAGTANIGAVAPGIAEALIATVAGLVAAIPAAIAYNYFMSRLNFFGGELEGFTSEFIGTLAREGRI
ncbi:MAG: MotA/TolQ/ExbB proton channel family protein [Gemmatimonadetes bacterium]|nr:MotA/TolQ/ExbB proton channel family protein [Gemmatimonadota bacterium]